MLFIFAILLVLCPLQLECLLGDYIHINLYKRFVENVKVVIENDSSISKSCSAYLQKYVEDLMSGELWALKMLDANSKLPTGFLNGRFVDLGSFDECMSINETFNLSENIHGKYCIGTFPLNLSAISSTEELVKALKTISNATYNGENGIQLATCMPHTCSYEDISLIYSAIGIKINFYEDLCQTKDIQPKLNSAAYTSIAFFGALLGIILLSTVYDGVLYYLQKEPSSLLIAFSIITNGRYIIYHSKDRDQISCLYGIRAITTMWIIYSHTRRTQYVFPTNNHFHNANWHKSESNMFLLNIGLSIDTFFVIGGLLVSYNYSNAVDRGKRFNIILHYVHRYVRLTPVFIALIVFYTTLLRYVGSGPLWPRYIERNEVAVCKANWWRALLYIQNFGNPSDGKCIPQSWYLSVDMQLYLLSPILLIPMRRFPKSTVLLTVFLTVCSAVYGFVVGWMYEIGIVRHANQTPIRASQYLQYYYFSTAVNAAPWLIGIIMGNVIFRYKKINNGVVINKVAVVSLWMMSIGTLCTCLLVGHHLVLLYDRVASSIHMSLVKPAWAIAISWIIFGCCNGYGGPFNWFLGLPFFEVLSKLTYSMYMVHHGVICVMRAQMRESTTQLDVQSIHAFWGDFVFTFVGSILLMLGIELPMKNIEHTVVNRLKGAARKPSDGRTELTTESSNVFQMKNLCINESLD